MVNVQLQPQPAATEVAAGTLLRSGANTSEGGGCTSASLRFRIDDRDNNVLLVAQPAVGFGRWMDDERNDVVLWPWRPVDGTAAPPAENISRHHFTVRLTPGGCFVEHPTPPPANGTLVDGEEVSGSHALRTTDSERTIVVGSALTLRACLDGRTADVLAGAAEGAAGGSYGPLWELADRAGVSSVRIRRGDVLGGDRSERCEMYAIIYRFALVGSGEDATVIVAGPGVHGAHARILHFQDRFWLQGLASEATTVDDRHLASGEMQPLDYGARIRLGEQEVRFSSPCQFAVGERPRGGGRP